MLHSIRRVAINGLAGLSILLAMLALPGLAQAGRVYFDGEPNDHFWNVDFNACRNGFKIEAHEVAHDGGQGDNAAYKLVLTGVASDRDDGPWSVPNSSRFLSIRTGERTLTPNLTAGQFLQYANGVFLVNQPARPHHELAEVDRTFFFTRPQQVGAYVTITLERWDHGLPNANEAISSKTNDYSGAYGAAAYDDVTGLGTHLAPLTAQVQDCRVP